jgi:hypothetical protein
MDSNPRYRSLRRFFQRKEADQRMLMKVWAEWAGPQGGIRLEGGVSHYARLWSPVVDRSKSLNASGIITARRPQVKSDRPKRRAPAILLFN